MTQTMLPRKNIVVLGAGFSGVAAARKLAYALKRNRDLRAVYDLIVVDRAQDHIYTPGLYEVATTAREDAPPLTLKHTAALSLEQIFAGLPIRIIQDEVTGVTLAKKAQSNQQENIAAPESYTIHLRDGGDIHAEYLLLALGAVVNDFGIPGVHEHGLMLKTFEDALRVRTAVTETFKQTPNAHVVIAGGGATGVELTGELVSLTRHVRSMWRKEVHPTFTLVEAGPRLIPGPPLRVAEIAKVRLEGLGVRVALNMKITEVSKNAAIVQSPDSKTEMLLFDRFIWSGGIKPSPVLANIVIPKDQRGRCMVDLDLTIHGERNLFAIGDLTCFADPATGQPLPAVASIAITEGAIAARNILARINKQPLHHYHPPKHTPMVIPICGKWAITSIFGVQTSGFSSFLFRLLIDLHYFVTVLSPIRALRFFIFSTYVYFKND